MNDSQKEKCLQIYLENTCLRLLHEISRIFTRDDLFWFFNLCQIHLGK